MYNKKDFIKYIKNCLNNEPLELQVEILNEIKNNLIPQILNEKINNHKRCEFCKKYILNSDYIRENKIETRVEITYSDAGYGDDDREGEIEYEIIYEICPICGNKKQVEKYYIRTLWEKGRGE